jgi:predicted acetyltransferase
MLEEAGAVGLGWVELTTEPDNPASRRTIKCNGGTLVETFEKPPAYGGGPALRFRIPLDGRSPRSRPAPSPSPDATGR